MNFTVSNKEYLKKVLGHILAKYREKSIVNISFEEVKKTKTKKQLGFIFGGIIKALISYFNSLGYDYDTNIIKYWLYYSCGVYDEKQAPDGSIIYMPVTLSQMDIKQASDFINRVIYFIDTTPILKGDKDNRGFCLTPDLRYCWARGVSGFEINEALEEKKPQLDESYLRYQRGKNCIYCGGLGNEVHHIKRGSGLGRKNPDWFTIPLCGRCHKLLHDEIGEAEFLRGLSGVLNGLDIKEFCALCYKRFKLHLE